MTAQFAAFPAFDIVCHFVGTAFLCFQRLTPKITLHGVSLVFSAGRVEFSRPRSHTWLSGGRTSHRQECLCHQEQILFSCQRTVRLSPGERTKNIRRYHVVRLWDGRLLAVRSTEVQPVLFPPPRFGLRRDRPASHSSAPPSFQLRSRFFFSGCHFRLSLWRGSCFVMRRGSRPGSRRGALFFSRCVKRIGVPMKSKASRRRFSRNR